MCDDEALRKLPPNSVGRSEVYKFFAAQYDLLSRRQDALAGNIRAALCPLLFAGEERGLLVAADLGAGTGKLSALTMECSASRPCVVFSIDRSPHMLAFAAARLRQEERRSGCGVVSECILADHRACPLRSGAVDVALAGWTLSEIKSAHFDGAWRREVGRAVAEMQRVAVRRVVLLETLGCGVAEPARCGAHLYAWLERPEDGGFVRASWVRSDYAFNSEREARDLTRFFFGKRAAKLQVVPTTLQEDPPRTVWIIQECTGLWSKQLQQH